MIRRPPRSTLFSLHDALPIYEMRRNSVKGISLITSKEQFVDLFKAESPEFDDEFFKDNALFVILTARDWYDIQE